MLDGVEVRRQVLVDCVIEAQLMCCVRRNIGAWPERRTDITSPAEDTPIGAMRHWTIARARHAAAAVPGVNLVSIRISPSVVRFGDHFVRQAQECVHRGDNWYPELPSPIEESCVGATPAAIVCRHHCGCKACQKRGASFVILRTHALQHLAVRVLNECGHSAYEAGCHVELREATPESPVAWVKAALMLDEVQRVLLESVAESKD